MADPIAALADVLGDLARVTLDLGLVERITYHPDGVTRESVTTHTVMLGLVACSLADRYAPSLDRGLIAQFALLHDLAEVYAGDTPTLRQPTAAQQSGKQAREAAARSRLAGEFTALPWLAATLASYERLDCPEACWVKAVDKLLPKLVHVLNGGVTVREQGLAPAEVADRYARQGTEIAGYVGWCEPVLQLRAELVDRVLAALAAGPGPGRR